MTNRRQFLISAAAFAAATAAAPAAFAGGDYRKGTFKGKSNHITTGGVKVVKEGGKYRIELQGDFSFDGAPDPKVAMGKNGYDKSTLMGKLKSNSGAQVYKVPASINVDEMNEVWIWCEQFNVPLGVAKLK